MMGKQIEKIIKLLENMEEGDRRVIFDHLKLEFEPPKKRGRKSTKIRDAYDAITKEPQDFEELRNKFDISEVTLKQHSRFDPFQERGKVRTAVVAGKRLIWREGVNDEDE